MSRSFFEELLGDEWELKFILGEAMAGPDAPNEAVDEARERAVAIVEEARPDLASAELSELVRGAWFTLSANPDDPRPSGDQSSL